MKNAIAVTVDVDWAPEWCIQMCIDILRKAGVKATFFVTHRSTVISSIAHDPQFELGIHPNFLENSSHGATIKEVMDHCLTLAPDAKSMRTHALVQSSPIFSEIADQYETIETDVSLFLPFHRYLHPTDLYMGTSARRLTRLPYFWEDDLMTKWPNWDWETVPNPMGLAIYDFHPCYIALNMTTMKGYENIKWRVPWRPLFENAPEDFAPYVETGTGTRSFFERLVNTHPAAQFLKISEITAAYRNGRQ